MELEAVPLSREQTLHIALGMGKALLKNGAETSRVEDTISRFCHTHGYHDIHVFVTPTVIILGDEESEGATIISRIRYRSTNLSVISAVNDFSYNLKRWPLNYEKTLAYLDELRHKAPPYGKWHVCMASAISSAPFRRCWEATAMTYCGLYYRWSFNGAVEAAGRLSSQCLLGECAFRCGNRCFGYFLL